MLMVTFSSKRHTADVQPDVDGSVAGELLYCLLVFTVFFFFYKKLVLTDFLSFYIPRHAKVFVTTVYKNKVILRKILLTKWRKCY